MKVHITIAEDAGAAPAAGAGPRLSVARDAAGSVDAGPAAAAGSAPPAASVGAVGSVGSLGSGMDAGTAPGWLVELVRLADAGEVARPGEEPRETLRPSEGQAMDAGSGPAAG
ncbi:hypothetical protein [Streptomyces sp. NPDC057302]|uniref:hypothetical protein n=1 Tax=Streptomyces sp. NPDC057302 TaxID=3346094 RepID=UPI0036327951